MEHEAHAIALALLLSGGIILACMFVKVAMNRTVFPAVIGFLALGTLLRGVAVPSLDIPLVWDSILPFLAQVGLVTLLFRIGLESDLSSLRKQIKPALMVWGGDVPGVGILSFLVVHFLFGISLIPSVIVAISFTATSVGVSVGIWEERKALKSSLGSLLLNLAVLDDVTAILLMALVFAILPSFHGTGQELAFFDILLLCGLFFLKFLAIAAACALFARYGARRLDSFFEKALDESNAALVATSIGLILASLAGLLGFSAAIGAFFAGLSFHGDNRIEALEKAFYPIYALFSPFFFLGIGLELAPDDLLSASGIGAGLFALAFIAKVIAPGIPTFFLKGWHSAILLGASMTPHAEITMVIVQRAHKLGDWAMPDHLHAAIIATCAGTCLAGPLAVRWLLQRQPGNAVKNEDNSG